jgi:hypothetical protein
MAIGLVLVVGACESSNEDPLIATAGDYTFTVSEAVDLLISAPDLPNQSQVVLALGELWVDYILLAEAGRRDSTMAMVDVEPLVRQQVELRKILALRDSAVEADTAIAEDELRTLYEEEAPGVVVHARHILLTYPESGDATQIDSVRSLAADLRERIVSGGEGFEELALEYSQDPGTAANGGDLGQIQKGQSMPSIEEALFALEPGEVSDVVESPYGVHLFRVDERMAPSFDEIRMTLRFEVQQRRYLEAESLYVAGLVDAAALEPVENAAALTRQMAAEPGTRLSGRAARRPVVRYRGGALTVQDVVDHMLASLPEYRGEVVEAPDDVVEDQLLRSLVQRRLLVLEAEDRGLTVPQEVQDSLADVGRANFVQIASNIGLLGIRPREGQSPREAVEERVEAILREMLSGNRDVIPAGAVSFTLRKQFPSQVFQSGAGHAVLALARARGLPLGTPSGATPQPDGEGDAQLEPPAEVLQNPSGGG